MRRNSPLATGYDPRVIAAIIRIGKQRGLGAREITAALSTGIVESGLRNLRYGDRDSQGVFQQRPSQGWGTVEQITTIPYAVNKFYDAIADFDAPGISGAELAARIQRPAAEYRGRYAERWGEAQNILRSFRGGRALAGLPGPSFPVPGVPASSYVPDFTVPTYPTTPLPIPADIQAEFAARRAAAQRSLAEAHLARRRSRADIQGDFQRFLAEIQTDSTRQREGVMDEASARNLALQPAFVVPGLKRVREDASAARATAVAEKAERLQALDDAVNSARRDKQSTKAAIKRDRARVRSELDRLIGI